MTSGALASYPEMAVSEALPNLEEITRTQLIAKLVELGVTHSGHLRRLTKKHVNKILKEFEVDEFLEYCEEQGNYMLYVGQIGPIWNLRIFIN